MPRAILPHGWKGKPLAELMRRSCAGESWVEIGASFYPGSDKAAHRVHRIFAHYAGEDEKRMRRAALASKRFNRPEHYKNFGRPTGTGGKASVEPPIKREREDLFAGLGGCFA